MKGGQNRQRRLLSALGWLTGLVVFAQISAIVAYFSANQLLGIVVTSFQPAFFYSKAIVVPLLQFILIQGALYAAYLFTIWYLAVSMGTLFSLKARKTYYLGVFLGWVGWIGIFAANSYYFPHSFFTRFIQDYLFNHYLTHAEIKVVLVMVMSLFFVVALLTLLNLILSVCAKQNRIRHGMAIMVMGGLVVAIPPQVETATRVVKTDRPNVIIIGFDALRPDCIGKNNTCKALTPNLNNLLRSSVYFANAYTPLARTSPSWTSILTGKYPKHHGARDNNVDIHLIELNETLPKRLQAAGYETFYATDDRRYNNVNEAFGFDRVIGPPIGLNDFLIGTLNDFPLSNLLVFSPWGATLFPYNYANHCAGITYNPDHFLRLIDEALFLRNKKPLFLAVHFNVGSWPFHWYNDNQPENFNISMELYKTAVEKADQQLGNFLRVLKRRNLLTNTLVVVLSDHGITLGLPGDRAISKHTYQGELKATNKLAMTRYGNAPPFGMDFKSYGLDTSYGYGGDVLSLKQLHTLLALKAYGVNIGTARTIGQTVSLLDIAPTLLDYLSLPPLAQGEGMSLKNYAANLQRAFYFETGLKDHEIEKEIISVGTALKNVVNNYQIDPKTGWVYINENTRNRLILGKEHAIVQGDWLLAHYPRSTTLNIEAKTSQKRALKREIIPAYFVLMNLKTQRWTLEWNTALAKQAPLKKLFSELSGFYGNEMGTQRVFPLS
jgi:arylsulfatase A-like enzyme